MDKLDNQFAIITGGGTGIGRAIAIALAQEGAGVCICGRRLDPLESTVRSIQERGGTAFYVQADVSKESDVRRLVGNAVETFGKVDILINNAAIDGQGFIHEHDVGVWDQVMAINLRGPFLLSRAVLPIMRGNRRGHIINISSEVGIEHYGGYGAYGVAKHALNALAEFMQRENQALGIRVNTICPGMVVTEMTEALTNLIPEKCLFPEDIADLVIWLIKQRGNVKFGLPMLMQTMENPWDNTD